MLFLTSFYIWPPSFYLPSPCSGQVGSYCSHASSKACPHDALSSLSSFWYLAPSLILPTPPSNHLSLFDQGYTPCFSEQQLSHLMNESIWSINEWRLEETYRFSLYAWQELSFFILKCPLTVYFNGSILVRLPGR